MRKKRKKDYYDIRCQSIIHIGLALGIPMTEIMNAVSQLCILQDQRASNQFIKQFVKRKLRGK